MCAGLLLAFGSVGMANPSVAPEEGFETLGHESDMAVASTLTAGRTFICASGTFATYNDLQRFIAHCSNNVCPQQCGGVSYTHARQWTNGAFQIDCECE